MRSILCVSTLLLFAGLSPFSNAAQHGNTTVVYSHIQSSPSSSVTGAPGLFINIIERPFLSPDGLHWMITVGLDTGSTTDNEVLIRDGLIVAREGTSPPFLPGGRMLGFMDDRLGVLNSGAFVFSGDMSGGSGDDDIVCMGTPGGTISLIAQEGTQIIGGPPGWINDNVDSPIITNLGVGFQTDSVDGGPPFGQDELFMLHGSLFLQAGVDGPTGQLSGLAETWDSFDFERTFVSSDGANYLIQGDLSGSGAEDDVVVLNGVVVLQENYAIPGGNPAHLIDASGIRTAYMADGGDWIAYGDFDVTNDGWVVHNGTLVAREGNPIHSGATELFDSAFNASVCNSVGDYVVVGSSDAPGNMDGVVVLNNQTVICREGDPIDLNGNGAFDDDTFVRVFSIDDVALSDDLKLHLVASLADGSGAALGTAYLVINAGGGPPSGTFCDPADNNSTGVPTRLSGAMGSGVGSGLHLEANDGPPNQFGYFLIGTGIADPGLPISQGHLCLSTVGGNAFGRYNVAFTSLNSIGVFNAGGVLVNTVSTSTTGFGYDVPSNVPIAGFTNVMAGQTWNFQLWHRESGGNSNFSNGVQVLF